MRYKSAFTMIELVFVIVIIGILSAVIAPQVKRATIDEAANQIASYIRYTQQLALNDNKFSNSDKEWYKGRWQIIFGKSKNSSGKDTDGEWAYSIFSDKPSYTGNPGVTEIAKDPLNPKQLLSGGYSGYLNWADPRANKKMNIGKKFDIKNDSTGVVFSGGCSSAKRLAFDYLGRPIQGNISKLDKKYYDGNTNRLVQTNCYITITNNVGESRTIVVTPETGYVYIQ